MKKGVVRRRAKAGERSQELQCPPGMKRKVEAGVQKKEEMEAG
ncbi:MAG: hypothetical protein ACLTDS_11570 [Bianqueaceae bacterium]